MIIAMIFALLVALIAVIFALQNSKLVEVSFLFWQTQGSLALVLLLTLAAGVLIGMLVTSPVVIKGSLSTFSERRKAKKMAKTLDEQKAKLARLEQDSQQNTDKPAQQ